MLCRICLTDVTPLIGIFSEDGTTHQLVDKIRVCLQLQVQKDDCFPDKVCCKCFMSVNEFFSFWKKARESYNLLLKLQKDVTLKQSVSSPNPVAENEDVAIESSPDLLDIIDMESYSDERTIADIRKQPEDCGCMNNFKGKGESTFSLLPVVKETCPSDITRTDTSRHSKPIMQPTHDTDTWINEKRSLQQQPQRAINEHHLDSKPNQFISKQFSFGRPSMAYGFPKEVQQTSRNSWGQFQAAKSESKQHLEEKEKQHENLSNSFSFSMKSSNSKDANSPFEQKPYNPGSQLIFSSNDEYNLPNIPLSLFSSSDDKKQTSLHSKTPMEIENAENLRPKSPIIGLKVSRVSQKPNDAEMTPRSKVMKMLNREIW